MFEPVEKKVYQAFSRIVATLTPAQAEALDRDLFAVQFALDQMQATDRTFREIVNKIEWQKRDVESFASRLDPT